MLQVQYLCRLESEIGMIVKCGMGDTDHTGRTRALLVEDVDRKSRSLGGGTKTLGG